MKRLIVFFICMTLAIGVYAKTTYIPFYFSSISITENGITKAVDGENNRLSLSTDDKGVKFTISHELVTKDKVKSIKSAKSSAGWTAFSVGMAQGGGTTEAVSGARIMQSANDAVNEAQSLYIELLIENNTDEDIFIGDMNKGSGYWHIPSKGRLALQLKNPEWTQLRVTNAYIHDNIERSPEWKQRVAYVTLAAKGYVEKKNVEFEDDAQIIYSSYSESNMADNTEKEYSLYDKETSISTLITKEEYLRIKKEKK